VSGSVSISVYVLLWIVLPRGRFGGLSNALVTFGAVGRTWDGYSFGSVLVELQDCFCCIPDVDLAACMLSGTPWHLHPFQVPTQHVM